MYITKSLILQLFIREYSICLTFDDSHNVKLFKKNNIFLIINNFATVLNTCTMDYDILILKLAQTVSSDS